MRYMKGRCMKTLQEAGVGNKKDFRTGEAESREPFASKAVQGNVRHQRGEPGPQPGPRFTEEERPILAQFFVLLDQMDRAQSARCERKEAA